MRSVRLPYIGLALLVLGCETTRETGVPRCAPLPAEERIAEECRAEPAVAALEQELAAEIADRLKWKHPTELPLRVAFDANAVVESICFGSPSAVPDWRLRSDVARALPKLRAAGPGPACLAGSSLDLTHALVVGGEPPPTRRRSRIQASDLSSCTGLREVVCTDQGQTVCGVFPDGTRRTYANACEACSNSFVKGYWPGACRD